MLLITRYVGIFVIPFLAATFVVLYGVPDRTTEFFAWTIRSGTTPLLMGDGVYFFYCVTTTERWREVASIFPGIATFTWFFAIATALHWENVSHGHQTFYLRVFLYALTPVLIPPSGYSTDEAEPSAVEANVVELPRAVRLLCGDLGIVVVGSAVALFLVPELMIGVWPWAVSPLTTRILIGWFDLFGVVNPFVARDPRWSAARIPIQTRSLGFALVLAGVPRVWNNHRSLERADVGRRRNGAVRECHPRVVSRDGSQSGRIRYYTIGSVSC
ncbi:MAG: hypothetical protein ACQET5_02850 [Halobacteriota archaeon]|uniref:hypothetical protein n=1 Tax=Natronomonas sp. TaxID=2184060 RepID=UPI003975490A